MDSLHLIDMICTSSTTIISYLPNSYTSLYQSSMSFHPTWKRYSLSVKTWRRRLLQLITWLGPDQSARSTVRLSPESPVLSDPSWNSAGPRGIRKTRTIPSRSRKLASSTSTLAPLTAWGASGAVLGSTAGSRWTTRWRSTRGSVRSARGSCARVDDSRWRRATCRHRLRSLRMPPL